MLKNFNLQLFKDLFHHCFEENGYSYDESDLDWSHHIIPTNLYKVNLNDKVCCNRVKTLVGGYISFVSDCQLNRH